MKVFPTLAALGAMLLAGPAVGADGGWGLEAEALTEFPSLLGGGLRVHIPYGFEVAATAGVMPGGYAHVVSGTLRAFDALNQTQAKGINEVFQDSRVLRATVAWQPWTDHGIWFEAGYARMDLGGRATGRDLVEIATGLRPSEMPDDMPSDADGKFDLDVTAHRLHLGLGWRWDFPTGLTMRAGFGGDITLGASTRIHARFDPEDPELVDAYRRAATREFDHIVTDYVHNPTVLFDVGYRFF
jgi:hypothetical protein